MRDQQLFRRVAHRSRIVHHQRLRVDVLQQVSRRDVGHVEWRVLAHQNHVHQGQVQQHRIAEAEMLALRALHADRPGACL